MESLNQINFEQICSRDLHNVLVSDYGFGSYKKEKEHHILDCCTCCEEKGLCSQFLLDSIWHGATTNDYLQYIEDAPDAKDWIDTHVMIVFANPSKSQVYDQFEMINGKQVMSTWPYIGWDSAKSLKDFAINDCFVSKAYGKMVCSAILNYKLKNVYVTNLVKCDHASGKGLKKYPTSIIQNCVNQFFIREVQAFRPKCIFAAGVDVLYYLKNTCPQIFSRVLILNIYRILHAVPLRMRSAKECFVPCLRT